MRTNILILTLFCSGCSAVQTQAILAQAEQAAQSAVATYGAGHYTATGTITKDGQPILGFTEAFTCAAANGQLTGCHHESFTVAPLGLAPIPIK